MIEWKRYDENNPPDCGREFLVFTKYASIKAAELELWTDGEYRWTENQEQTIVHGVTHYAEINLPSQDSNAAKERWEEFGKIITEGFKKE